MPLPIVIAHHLIWTLYGWWLPNDPRGSCSQSIRNDVLKQLGDLHYGRKRIQPPSRDIRAFYDDARPLLKFPLLDLSSSGAIAAVATGFADAITAFKYTCYACAILPDHVHLILRKHKHTAEEMIEHLQQSSRLRLSALGLRTTDHPTCAVADGRSSSTTPTNSGARSTTSNATLSPTECRFNGTTSSPRTTVGLCTRGTA